MTLAVMASWGRSGSSSSSQQRCWLRHPARAGRQRRRGPRATMDALRYARRVQSSEQAGAWPLAISLLLDRPRSFIHPSPAACRSQQVGGVAAASSSSSARDARHAIPRGCSLAARGPAAWRACPCISIRSAPYNPIHWGSVAHLASAPSPIQQPLQADPCVGHTRFSATTSPRPQAPCRAALLFRRRSGRGGGLVVVMAAPQSLNRRVGRELVTREPRVEGAVGAVSCRRGLAAPRTLPRYRGPWLLASCGLYACVGRSRFVGTPPPPPHCNNTKVLSRHVERDESPPVSSPRRPPCTPGLCCAAVSTGSVRVVMPTL
jgi:hypothetical protein